MRKLERYTVWDKMRLGWQRLSWAVQRLILLSLTLIADG